MIPKRRTQILVQLCPTFSIKTKLNNSYPYNKIEGKGSYYAQDIPIAKLKLYPKVGTEEDLTLSN